MSKPEMAQLYTAAGFPIVRDQPVNRCGKPAKPGVKLVDLNGDQQPEALFVDADADCYPPSGRYFAVLTKDGGTWRAVTSGTGSIQALPRKTAGWLDMRVSDSGCTAEHRYDGRAYKAVTNCSGEPLLAQAPAARAPAPRGPAAQPPAPEARSSQSPPAPAPSTTAPAKLELADEAAAFKAAGFKKRGREWKTDCNDPNYSGGIESVADLNGDGLPDAVLVEGGTGCYGMTGQGFFLVTKLADGSWKLMTGGSGIPEFLKTRGAEGWPDVSVGGPGFCFPVMRWNGKEYKVQRWEYEGKACKLPR